MNLGPSTRWDYGLQGQAKLIAELKHSPLRVLAGPGTGKTFALIRRVARLLQDGANPRRLLVSTFTRTAAGDLEKELKALGIQGTDRVRAGTLHAFCFALLSRADVLPLIDRVPRPLLSFEERFLLQDLEDSRFGGIRKREERLHAFSAAWARLQTDLPGWPHDPTDKVFHHALLAWLKFHQAMLVGEIVPEALRYLRLNPASPDRRAFDHVLVDEYQDLNRAEQVLLDLLAEGGALTVIGDEDQSIYSFKHAHPEGILTFDTTHPGTHNEPMTACRRCPRLIVDLANSLISNNQNRANRTLQPHPANPLGEVHVLQWPTMQAEARGIAALIKERIDANAVTPGRALVLAPRRHLGYAIRTELNRNSIPAHSFFHEEALDGNPKKLDESQAQQAFALLTLLISPDDRVALRCWCGFGSSSLRSPAWRRLREHCENSGEHPRAALESMVAGHLRIPRTDELVQRFKDLQSQMASLQPLSGATLRDAILPPGKEWSEPLRSIAETIEGDNYDPKQLHTALRIGVTQPELPTDVDYVRVMSLHKSKGLTADLVVVVGCIEGLIPFLDDEASPAQQAQLLEEQRRLFYVAITRTRQTLVLSSVTRLPVSLAFRMHARIHRRKNSLMAGVITSRFLAELGPSLPTPIPGPTLLKTSIQ